MSEALEKTTSERQQQQQQEILDNPWCNALSDGGIRGGIGKDVPVWLLRGWHEWARFEIVDAVYEDSVAHQAAWSMLQKAISRASLEVRGGSQCYYQEWPGHSAAVYVSLFVNPAFPSSPFSPSSVLLSRAE